MRIKHSKLILLAVALAFPCLKAVGQGHEMVLNDTVSWHQVEMRQNATFTYKLPHDFSISLDEELREVLYSGEDSAKVAAPYFHKSYTTLEVGYKMLNHQSLNTGNKYALKLDLGYTLKFDATDKLKPKKCLQHRPYAALTATMDVGNWELSLKETYRVDIRLDSVQVPDKWDANVLVAEKNPYLMELKSRLKIGYTFPGKPVKLYASGEVAVTLNEKDCPWVDAAGRPFYEGQYLRSAKGQVGVRWRIDRNNALTFSYMYYYKHNRDINVTGKNSTTHQDLELVHERIHTHALVVAYDLGY